MAVKVVFSNSICIARFRETVTPLMRSGNVTLHCCPKDWE